MKDKLTLIKNDLLKVIVQFKQNPFLYFYEEDLRVDLVTSMKNSLDESIFFNIPSNFNSICDSSFIIQKKHIKSSPIKTEYPVILKNKRRFDIVYLENNGYDFYNLKPKLAIELKLGSDLIGSDKCLQFKKDFKKLVKYRNLMIMQNETFTGIATYFYQTEIKDKLLFNKWFSDTFLLSEIDYTKLTIEENCVNVIIVYPGSDSIYISNSKPS